MPVEVRVPALGESVLEATVGGWLKSEGDVVAPGDPLVELETEKVAVEVTAEGAGVLERIAHREGDTVHVGDVLPSLAGGRDGSRRPARPSGRGDAGRRRPVAGANGQATSGRAAGSIVATGRRAGTRRAGSSLPTPAYYRPPAARGAADRGDPHHLQ